MATTSKSKPGISVISDLYRMFILDCLIDIAYSVSEDFFKTPDLYQKFTDQDGKIPAILTKLHGSTGFDPLFPNKGTRQLMYLPLFGYYYPHLKTASSSQEDNQKSQFSQVLSTALQAAADFSENAQPTGFPMLRERIRSALVPFRTHLLAISGTSSQNSLKRILNSFQHAVAILRAKSVYSVFGINSDELLHDEEWPLFSSNTDGATLIEKVTQKLETNTMKVIHRAKFNRMQRISQKGGSAIEIILASDKWDTDNELLDKLTALLYAWGSDLGMLSGQNTA